MRFSVDRIDHVVLNCRDLGVTANWYERVLGMEREAFGEPPRACLKFGGQKINLRPHDADCAAWLTAARPEPGTQDLCFVVAVGTEDVVEHLRACAVAIEAGPVDREGALGLISSIYCRDPDGNLVEIATYL